MASFLLSTISKAVCCTQVQLCAQWSAKRHMSNLTAVKMITGILRVEATQKLSAVPYSHQQLDFAPHDDDNI